MKTRFFASKEKNIGARGVAWVVKSLTRKCKALSSNPAPQKKEEKVWKKTGFKTIMPFRS
jgi:hypothetical protein